MTTRLLIKGRRYASKGTFSKRVLTFVGRDEIVRNRFWFSCPAYETEDNPKGEVYTTQHEINRYFSPTAD